VRRGAKVVIWTGVFIACAGAGAYVAAHTNPFPPGVEDPGARPTTPPPSSSPQNERWNLVMDSATRHELHVGGSCRSGWGTAGVITIHPDGTVTGTARARVRGWGCDFAVAQVQTRVIRLGVRGARTGDRVQVRFSIIGSTPAGSQDLGGFTATIGGMRPELRVTDGHAGGGARASRPDGDLGRYINASEIQLDCATGC
jgi:hypothetical protein